jgi:hypothetical protein
MTPDAPKTEAQKIVASKKPASTNGGVSKSDAIRKVANAMKAKGEKPRPKTIIEVLKKDGVVVSSPQVSMVLKKMGFRPRKRRKGKEVAAKSSSPSTNSKTKKIKVEDLVRAKKVAAQLGGVEKALAAIKALKDFEG